ncbi:MAG TPA: YegS/Rv2252/BmrU family lipid kinase [Ignavibacteriaceae bacterium]|nr:YegS/Rv2252/BmrU family lipid kinase [Ignavibacteriaceae bacterium]
MLTKYQIIFNPASAGGRTLERKQNILNLLYESFGNNFDLNETKFKGDATNISHSLAKNGYSKFIIVGGDGTIQECVNGLFESGKIIIPDTTLGIISSGTGQGFSRSVGIPLKLKEQIKIIKNGNTRHTDIGNISWGNNGSSQNRFFINEFQAGIGGAVVKSCQGKEKRFGGTFAYGLKTLSKVFTHPNQLVTINFDNHSFKQNVLGIVVANGEFTGGSMNLVPGADTSDHFLDLLIMHGQNVKGRINSFRKIYSGNHLQSSYFSKYRLTSLSIASDENVLMEADGEVLGYLPCSIEIIPSAIKIYSDKEK